jgi:prolyl-tRNA synthetase
MMGSYGIGVSRLVGAMIEASHDDKGIIWQRSVAPFLVGLINLKQGDEATDSLSEQLYERLRNANIDVLYHDKKDSAGAKMATIELIGLPYMAIIGPKRAAKSMVELKCRKTGAVEELTIDAIVNKLLNH